MVAKLAPTILASLVTKVMATSCGIDFLLASDERGPPIPWRMASLPINGGRPVDVLIASDEPGCFALASGLLQMAPADLDPAMVEDSLRELVNMLAGQIKRAMSLDQALGLPEIVKPDDVARRLAREGKPVMVTSGSVQLMVWVMNRK